MKPLTFGQFLIFAGLVYVGNAIYDSDLNWKFRSMCN
jgi:hypothetical protein